MSLFDVEATNRDAVPLIPLPFAPGRWHFPACVAVSPDAKQLAVGCWDSTIRIHAVEDGRQLRILTNHTAWVGSVAFSGDGQWLASACADHSTKVWRTHDWQETVSLRGHLEEVWSVAFTPDGQRLVTGSKDGSVRLWPLAGSSRSAEEVSVNANGYLDLSGTCPVAVGPSNILTVWDGRTLEVRHRLSSYPAPDLIFVWPSPDGRLLLMGTANGGVWLTGIPPDVAIPSVCLQTNGSEAVNVQFSDAANWVALSDRDKLQVWNLTNQPPYPGVTLSTGKFWQVRFSPNERLLSAVTGPIPTERTVFVWDLASGEELVRFRPHRDNVSGIAFSPDNAVLATSSEDNTCKLLDLRRGRVTTLRGQRMALHSVCFSPDGDRLATGTGDGSIIIWDLHTGREVLVLRKHLGEMNMVRAVRFDPNGDSLVSVHDNKVHLWRAPSWQEIAAAEATDRMQDRSPQFP
jgi:WD40 repeat protein